jgi:hypothetical protein
MANAGLQTLLFLSKTAAARTRDTPETAAKMRVRVKTPGTTAVLFAPDLACALWGRPAFETPNA